MRDLLLKTVRPLAEKFASALADLMATRIQAEMDRVNETLHGALAAYGGAEAAEPSVSATAPKKPSKRKSRKARPARAVADRDFKPENIVKPAARASAPTATTRGKPRVRPARSCRKCGEPGRRSDGCGITHNIAGAKKATADDDSEGEPRAVRRRRPAVELEAERVIPHVALVAMLAADRANNAVGDAGGFVVRADREPSLVGHTEERRELCPIHGWVGRVAFDRDKHELCRATDGEVCHSCDGRRLTYNGHWCDRCEGSGIEPVEPDAPDITAVAKPVAARGFQVERDVTETGRQRPKRTAPRSFSLAVKRITRASLQAGEVEVELAGPAVDEPRPMTRGECAGSDRPCPWVGCRHHLFLDVDPDTGSIKFNFPNVEPEDLAESCSLDIADRGPLTLEVVGNLMNVTRERTRQIERVATHNLRTACLEKGIDADGEDEAA